MSTPQQQTFTFHRTAEVGGAPLRRNKVIEAGAGTGKTTAIVAEVLQLLLGDADIAPERIVLVTFTEKAAGEIADRIEDALNDIRSQLESHGAAWPRGSDHPLFTVSPAERDACRRAVERQLARIDGLRSQTIHSFCQSLLRQYPIEAGVDPQFRIIEGFDRSLLYGQIYDAWIDDETRLHPNPNAAAEWEALLEHYGYLFQAKSAIFTLVDKRHIFLDRRYDIGTIAEYEPALRTALETYSRYFGAPPAPPEGSSIDAWIDYFAPMAVKLRKMQRRGDEPLKDCLRVLRGDKTGSCVYDLLISHRAADALLELATRFMARLDEEKRKRGVLDFDDLLIRTRMLLDDASALDRIRKQYDYIFVDEFQDTDRVQVEIFDRLARDRSGSFVPGRTIVVGDPKQSIYSFRRADPETYSRFTESLVADQKDFLVDQYRSTPELVRTLNAIGPALFTDREPDPNVFQPKYHALKAARAAAEVSDAPLTFVGSDGNEAEAIVAWIRGREHQDLRRFALLFRRKTKMEEYLEVFDRHGLPYVVPPMGLFLDRPAAVDLLAVLRAIAYRYDRGAIISAARSPYFALTDAEIANGILSDASPEWKAVVQSLETFRDAARHLTVTELIDGVVTATQIEAVYHATREGGRLLRQLEQVRSIAFIYDQKVGGSLRQFVEEISRRREVPEEVEPSLLDETTNAIRVLTIHSAKGLEFDTVILPDIEFQSSSSRDSIDLFTVEDPPSLVMRDGIDTLSGVCRLSDNRPLKEIGSLRDKAETRRLFYVAITRAKTQVAIVCNNADKVTNRGFGRYLCEIFDVNSMTWPADPGVVTRDLPLLGISVALEKVAPLQSDRAANRRLHDPELEATLASGAIVPCQVPHPDPPPLLPRAEVAIARNAIANRGAGILLHRVLERWDGVSDVAPLLAKLAIEVAADERSIDLVGSRLTMVSNSTVFRRIANANTIGREMPIAFLDENGAIVQKRIDRLIREGHGDTVIDYKSGAPNESRLERDRDQVSLYCRVVAKMTGRACRGLLWYIDVENDVAVDVK
ncbi:MAG TPA: UvrD-helicase domain-containing protein [Thermoanaerobaculia bacterium]|nr:UvrD-helicase domain-containing protein [Thermoanaerobaculia bacterium]